MAGSVSRPIPDFDGLIREQCDVLVDGMQALVEYLEDGGEDTAGKLGAIWCRGDALKQHHLDVLERTSMTPIHVSGIARAIVTLDMAIDCAKTTAGYILDLGLPADGFMFEMAAENKNCAQALQRGFYQLTTNPLQAEDDARAVYIAKRNIEEIHRYVLSELVDDDETVKIRKVDRTSLKAMSAIFGMLQRREIYYYLPKSAKRLVWAANRLREIVSHPPPH